MKTKLINNKKMVPETYEEFYSIWYVKLKNHVYYKNFPESIVEDVTQELMLQFLEGDYLNIFDPEKQTINKRTGLPTKVKFSTFVYSWANKVLLGKRDRYRRLFWREGLSSNAPLSNDNEEATFLKNLQAVSDNYQCELDDLIRFIRDGLKKRKVTSIGNDMLLLFDKVLEHVLKGPPEHIKLKNKIVGFSPKALAMDLGVSNGGLHYMMKSLRTALRELGVGV